MPTETSLKLELAKLKTRMSQIEESIQKLSDEKDTIPSKAHQVKLKVIEDARVSFVQVKERDKKLVMEICDNTRSRVGNLLDAFPDASAKEFSGRYEIKELEAKLGEIYSDEFVSKYRCPKTLEFEDEGEAYQAYSSAERQLAVIKQRNLAAFIFSSLTSLMEAASEFKGLGAKVGLLAVGTFTLSLLFAPMLFLFLLTTLSVISFTQGRFLASVMQKLCSVKQFLNDEYDEDIFQRDKNDIMEEVDEFLSSVKEDYIVEINQREFKEPDERLAEIDATYEKIKEDLERKITMFQHTLDELQEDVNKKLAEYDELVEKRRKASEESKEKFLGTFKWEHKWLDVLLFDIAENRVIACNWKKLNSLYLSEKVDQLFQFGQLVIYQNLLHVHPTFSRQIVLDYQYMGGNLVPFSKLPVSGIDICSDFEKIDAKITYLDKEMRARCSTILQSCVSIEAFNDLMATYDAPGESYIIVHVFGATSCNSTMRAILKNGPKVGIFVKYYFTLQELKSCGDDFPFSDIAEFWGVSESLTPRSAGQVQRIISEAQ